MARRFYSLPPLTSLATFETAARHGSFKQAASELNVTPGAVSHQLKALEAELQVTLFQRVHRGVELTSEGERLFSVLARSFQQTADTIEQIRGGGNEQIVTVGATTAAGALWLMPRISAFWREHPGIWVNQRISDDAAEAERVAVDLSVRYGSGNWPALASELLFCDEIVPVCSPEFAAKHPDLTPQTISGVPLVQLCSVNVGWTNWREWFTAMGLGTPPITGPVFNNYTIALQATQDGAGIVLGWRKLIGEVLEKGDLVPITEASLPSPGAFYLTWSKHRSLSQPAEVLRDWLLKHSDGQF